MHNSVSLNGPWEFIIDPANRGLTWGRYHQPDPAGAGDLHRRFEDLMLEEVPVPGSWQLYREAYRWYDGTAFFFKQFRAPECPSGARVWLKFHAVSFRARAWLNGVEIGAIDHPFLPWTMDVTTALRAENLLVVRVEGASGPDDTIPVIGWRQYAGLIRPVELIVTGATAWDEVYADPELDLAAVRGRLRLRLKRQGDLQAAARLVWRLGERSGDIQLKPGQAKWSGHLPWQPVVFWSPESPRLYPLRLELQSADGAILDVWEKPIGFRSFRWDHRQLFLNGSPIFLRGISRHDQSVSGGMTLTDQEINRDMDLIQELGCNAVRIAHYPQDERVLDECDRRGLLAWVEAPVYWEADWSRPIVKRRMLAQMADLLRRDYHHPAVVIWSVANEIHSDNPRALAALKAAHTLVRRIDPMRPTTFATWPKDPNNNGGLQVVDVCALNRYRGWYDPDVPKLADDLRGIREAADKPVILSEFGAGAVAGMHGADDAVWTEEYQARVLGECLEIARRESSGCLIWLLHDFLDPSRVYSKITDGFLNNKGLVTIDRNTRKIAFETVRRYFTRWAQEDDAQSITKQRG